MAIMQFYLVRCDAPGCITEIKSCGGKNNAVENARERGWLITFKKDNLYKYTFICPTCRRKGIRKIQYEPYIS